MTDELHTVALMAATMHAARLAPPARLPNPATADDIALEERLRTDLSPAPFVL
jgi:hypothetical protein